MPTPDEIFEQVLAEEEAKGSSPAVAQARAKAARVRAARGAADPRKPDPSTAPAPDRGARSGEATAESEDRPAAAASARPAAGASRRPAAAAASSAGAPAQRAVGN